MLAIGTKAPDLAFADKDGNMVSLESLRGHKVALYFYPRDNTAGCTRQACAYARNYPAFEQSGALVVGISKDSVKSHAGFALKHNLPFILLSDTELSAIQAYDVWKEKKALRQSIYGRSPHDLPYRRKRRNNRRQRQGKARH